MKREIKPNQNKAGTNTETSKLEVKSMKPKTNKLSAALPLCLSILQLFNTLPVRAAEASSSADLSGVKVKVTENSSQSSEQAKKLRAENQNLSTTQAGSSDGQVSIDSLAGGNSGGGGNAVVCFSNPTIVKKIRLSKENGGGYIDSADIKYITSVEMLDLRKAKQPRIIDGVRVVKEILTANPGESEVDFEARLRGRFKDVNPEADRILNFGKNLITEFRAVPNGIAPVNDVGRYEVYNTDDCVRVTIIAQYDEENKTQVIYDERIFNLPEAIFSVENRVASRWHEYFYAIARSDLKAINSQPTQTLVGRLFLKDLKFGELVGSFVDFYPNYPKYGSYERLYNGLIYEFIKNMNEDLKKNNLSGYSEGQKLDAAGYNLLLPIIGLSLIPASIAYNAKAHNFEERCNKKLESLSTDYEQRRALALSLLNLRLQEMKKIFPLNSEELYQKISDQFVGKIEKAQIEKFVSTENDAGDVYTGWGHCRINDNFDFTLKLPEELRKDLLDLKL